MTAMLKHSQMFHLTLHLMNSRTPAEESQASFNLVFTLSIFTVYGSSFPLGYLFDRLGTWKHRIIVGTMYTVGVALITFSTPATSFLLYPAAIIISSSAVGIFFSNLQVASLTKSYRGLTISLLNGLISTSAVVFLLVKKGYDSGINLRFMLIILLCATMIIWIRTFVLMPSKLIPFPPPNPDFEYGYKEWICFKTRSVAEHFVPVSLFVVGASQPVADQVIECTNNKTINSQDEISFKTCLKNKLFWTNLFHYSVITLRTSIVFAILQTWLGVFTLKAEISQLTDDFGTIILFVGLVAPLNGILFDSVVKKLQRKHNNPELINLKAFFVSMSLTSIFGMLLSLMMMLFSPYGTFAFTLITRSFVFGGNATFLSVSFPSAHLGKLIGLANLSSALTSLLQYPILYIAFAVDPTFYYINLVFLIVIALTLIHPLLIYFDIKKHHQHKTKI